MSAALASKQSLSKSSSDRKSESPYKRLHVIIPIEDMLWASQQKSSVTQLWQECWTSDPYGSRWMPLSTTLGYSTFIQAKKILSESGLFIFKPDKSIQDGRETVGWIVRNLHGSRMKDFWEEVDSTKLEPSAQKQQPNSEDREIDAVLEEMRASNQAPISGQTQSEQTFQKPSRTAQEHLTNSSKEFVRCVSSTPTEILPVGETAHAPFGGASPQIVEGVEMKEEEDLPMATDCTTLTLVDTAQSNPATFAAEKQVSGEEVRDCHEGVCSAAASIVEEEKELTQSEIFEWLDRADVGECPPLWVIQYLLDSKYYASMRATLSKFEKRWNVSVVNYQVQKSSEAMPQAVNHAARSKVKSLRMEKLKMALMVGGEKPDFDFLQECWNDDPALRIIIKQMIAKYPVWGIVCVDGVLVDWNKE